MKICEKIWLNGKIAPVSDAKLLSFSQGLNYGACVYEGIRCYNTPNGSAAFRLKEHINRFFYSAGALGMKLGFSKSEVQNAIKTIIKANKVTSGYIRPMAFYSEPKMGINILNTQVTFLILVWPWNDLISAKSTRLFVTKYRRLAPDTVDLRAKISGYYANGLLGFIDAQKHGYEQPLFLDENGNLAEGAISNIFVVKKNKLYTPREGNILSGITRNTIIKIARDSGLTVAETNMQPRFLKTADEVFLTGTGVELQPVTYVQGHFKSKGSTEITTNISNIYKKVTSGGNRKYRGWVTYV